MPSLITQEQKDIYSDILNDLHDTFARAIVFYKEPEQMILSSDPNYNPYYNNSRNIQYVQESGIIGGRILYNKQLEKNYSTPEGGEDSSFRFVAPDGFVRVKIRKEDWEIFKDVTDITFDGLHFENYKTPRPHGLFDVKYYTLYLKIKT